MGVVVDSISPQGVVTLRAEGDLKGADLDVAAFAFWSVVHGIASLAIRRRTPFPQRPAEDLGHEAVDFFMTLITPNGRPDAA